MDKEIVHIETQLKNLAGDQTGFSAPISYFQQVEKEVFTKSLANTFSETEGYAVPDSYFKNLEEVILYKIQTKESKVISLRKRVIQWIPVAAAAMIVVFLTFNLINISDDEVTQEDIISWFEQDITSMTNQDLVTTLEDEDLNETDFLSNSISETEIEQYLTNQDLTSLIEDLNQ